MAEEMIDVELNLGVELARKIKGMTKAELINRMVVLELRLDVHKEDEQAWRNEINMHKDGILFEKRSHKDTQLKLSLAESYVAQAKAMIESVMERWDEYDV